MGSYTQSDEITDQGATRKIWSREPVEHLKDIDVTDAADKTIPLDGNGVFLDTAANRSTS
jgi:hypothetical protein